jgi:hypothetical protein
MVKDRFLISRNLWPTTILYPDIKTEITWKVTKNPHFRIQQICYSGDSMSNKYVSLDVIIYISKFFKSFVTYKFFWV